MWCTVSAKTCRIYGIFKVWNQSLIFTCVLWQHTFIAFFIRIWRSLLHRASEETDPVKRMQVRAIEKLIQISQIFVNNGLKRRQYVAAFAVSGLASSWLRLGKPFNPLLGETYQLERSDFRLVEWAHSFSLLLTIYCSYFPGTYWLPVETAILLLIPRYTSIFHQDNRRAGVASPTHLSLSRWFSRREDLPLPWIDSP